MLAALRAQTRAPDIVVAVDTASVDGSVELLTQQLDTRCVRTADRERGFGDAVTHALAGLDAAAADGWIWLLHDDCAPAPDALERLLDEAMTERAGEPPVAVVGPKVREWPSLRRLLEVGVSLSGTGARETGLEPGEPDQGQRDDARQVLAVGTAGCLVRRSAWDELDGLDQRLPLYGDDIDLGWRVTRAGWQVRVAPAAVVFHAEASARDLRTRGAVTGRPRREQRTAALFVLLANCRGRALPVQYVRLLAGSLLRAAALLAVKAPTEAWDEFAAAALVLGRPWGLVPARRARRATAQSPPSVVRRLLPPAAQPYRNGAAAVAEVVAGLVVRPRRSTGPRSWIAARPWAALALALVVVSLLAARALLTGGELQGGALLPAPDAAGDWWASYIAGWHPVGTGSTEPAPPYALLLAAGGLLTFGDAGATLSLLLLGAPVLAALGAHRLSRRAGAGPVAAGWAGAAYGALPLATGAVAQGRLGTVVATVVAPLLASAVLSLVAADTAATGPARVERWVRRSRAGLMAAVLVAFAPVAWPLLVLIALLVIVLGALRAMLRQPDPPLAQVVLSAVAVTAVPWLLGPWWLAARVSDPRLWWWEAGLPDAGVGGLDPGSLQLALGMPGGPGGVPAWLGAGVLLAAAVALTRPSRRGPVLVAWSVGALGLLLAALGVSADAGADPAGGLTTIWVGFPLVVWWGALLVAAAVGSRDLRPLLAGQSFGWRQVAVTAVAVLALLSPLATLAWAAADGTDPPLRRGAPVAVPAYMSDDARSGRHESTAMLVATGDTISTTVVRDDGWRTGEEPMRAAVAAPALTGALSGLLATPTPADLRVVSAFGIGYLYLPGPVDADLASALDAVAGLERAGAPDGDRAWRLADPTGTVRVDGRGTALTSGRDIGGPPWTATPPRLRAKVSIAAVPDPAWGAEWSGRQLSAAEPAEGDVVQTFTGEAIGGALEVTYDDPRGRWVAAQLGGLLALMLLAAPTRRSRL